MKKKIDWMVTLVPFIIIVGIAVILFIWPRESNDVIHQIRFFWRYTGQLLFDHWLRRFIDICLSGVFKVWKYRTGRT